MTAKNNKLRREQIDTLVDLLLSERDLPAELLESIQAWLIDRNGAVGKNAALGRGFDRMLDTVFSKEFALESWPKLAVRLGMDPDLAKRALGKTFDRGEEARKTAPTARRNKPGAKYFVRYAAAAIICLTAIPAFYIMAEWAAQSRDPRPLIASPTDTLRLPDGSKVVMRPNSSITYSAGFAKNRKITINGEAYFSVTRDDRHPFTVEGKGIKATVAGTEFNMRAFDSEDIAEVTLITGNLTITSGELNFTLKPNERATIDRAGNKMEISGIDGGMLKAQGMNLRLDGVSLDMALTMIGDYFGVEMNIRSDLPPINRIVLDLDKNAELEDALFLLQAANPVFDYRIEGSSVSIIKR